MIPFPSSTIIAAVKYVLSLTDAQRKNACDAGVLDRMFLNQLVLLDLSERFDCPIG
jgi:hypothetical protein